MVDLRGEAEATIMELRVRDELMAAGRPDPVISGATAADKMRLWEEHKAGSLTRAALVEEIALLFARGEQMSRMSYWDYYGANHARSWDANNPPPGPLPMPPVP